MGFGIALLGYAFLLLHEMGGAIFAAPLLAYGFFLATRLESTFLKASISSLFLFPRAILQVCSIVGIFDMSEIPTLSSITFILHLLAWLFMSFFWLSAVIKIAQSCQAEKLENQARNRLVFTEIFIALSLVASLLNMGGLLGNLGFTVNTLQYIIQYLVIIVNVLFLHTCFVLITSEKQYEKDKQELAKEQAKSIEKMQKKRQEAAKKLEERNNRKK